MSRISFNSIKNPFFKSLKEKVDTYFESENIISTGNNALYFKGIVQVFTAIALYVILIFIQPSATVSILLCIVLGADLAFIGFNIMHEGVHKSFSDKAWINGISAYALNVMGGSSYFWTIKHTVNHHTYTNIEGMDDDIVVKPFMRLHASQPKYAMHRFQYIYWVILYGISYFTWVYVTDFIKYFSNKIASGQKDQNLALKEHLIFWATKVSFTILYLLIPIYYVGWAHTLIGFTITTFVCGLTIGVVFQMAHVVEDTAFPKPHAETFKIDQEWAIHQVATTANFGTSSKTLSWFLGGLNFQVEHHLFPKISHVHYPAISILVKETCKEFDITYIEYPSMATAFWSHLKHIKKMGISA